MGLSKEEQDELSRECTMGFARGLQEYVNSSAQARNACRRFYQEHCRNTGRPVPEYEWEPEEEPEVVELNFDLLIAAADARYQATRREEEEKRRQEEEDAKERAEKEARAHYFRTKGCVNTYNPYLGCLFGREDSETAPKAIPGWNENLGCYVGVTGPDDV